MKLIWSLTLFVPIFALTTALAAQAQVEQSHDAEQSAAGEHEEHAEDADTHAGEAHTEDAHAASSHGAGGGGSTNPLTIDPDLAICTLIVFIVLLAFLAKFAWNPIIDGLQKRENSIAEQIAQAQKSADDAKQTLHDYESKLASAADEVKGLIAQARKDADASKEQIVSEAKQAAQKERDRAVEDIRLAKEGAVQELAQKSVDAAVQLAGNMIRKEVDANAHSELIHEALHQFPSKN